MKLEVIILAAGQGTRMRSRLPKVMHPIAGKAMLAHVIDSCRALSPAAIHVVVGNGAEQVKAGIAADDIQWAVQEQQLGTGHAVAQAMPAVDDDSLVLVAYGDVPLVEQTTFQNLLQAMDAQTLALLTVKLDDPTGYGRIVRDDNNAILEIVEQKDATEEQQQIQEINTGILAAPAAKLKQWLPALSAENAQGEYYLTDIIAMAVADGLNVTARHPHSAIEVEGANNRVQLATLERAYQQRMAQQLMVAGASLADPKRIDVRGELSVGQDVSIDVNCVFIGKVVLADGVVIGPNCVIEDSEVGENCQIKANSLLQQARLANDCEVGPYARLRPGTQLAEKAKIGNFVETKKAVIGVGSKVNHLSYIGDTEIGESANIGAGTITCNYDGVNKHQTVIGDGAFIGSNSSLVAPVSIGKQATVGAGSTISSNVGDGQLAVARGKQRNIDGWKRPVKK